jgi:hypothetical protein
MSSADEYRAKAGELLAAAQKEHSSITRAELENIAAAYLRLADQADKNAKTDLVYESPRPANQQVQQHQQQQQQQPQPDKKKE